MSGDIIFLCFKVPITDLSEFSRAICSFTYSIFWCLEVLYIPGKCSTTVVLGPLYFKMRTIRRERELKYYLSVSGCHFTVPFPVLRTAQHTLCCAVICLLSTRIYILSNFPTSIQRKAGLGCETVSFSNLECTGSSAF